MFNLNYIINKKKKNVIFANSWYFLSKDSFDASFAFVIIITTKALLDNLALDLHNFLYEGRNKDYKYIPSVIHNMPRELIFVMWFYTWLLFGRSNNYDSTIDIIF